MRALILFAIVFGVASVCSQSHDLVLGQAKPSYTNIYEVNEYKYGFPFIVRTSVIEYPLPGEYNSAYIRAIYIKDHYTDGTGGYPSITSGGIGQRFVNIKLKSQRSYGFNFTVTIYGKY